MNIVDATRRVQTTIRLPTALMEQLRREADGKGYTVNDLIVFLLWKKMQRRDESSASPPE